MNPSAVARALSFALSLAALVVSAVAQEPASDIARLDELLRELAATGTDVWQARADAMRAAAAADLAAAKQLRADADARVKQAAALEKVAAELDDEAKQLASLRDLIASLRLRDVRIGPEGAAAAAARLERTLLAVADLPRETWDARLAATQREAGEQRAAAKAMRAEVAKWIAEAVVREQRAAALDAETTKLDRVRAALAALKLAPVPVAREAGPPAETGVSPAMAAPEPARLVTYDDDVFEIFEDQCITCHDPGDASGGLDLSTFEAAMQGGGSGRTVVAGKPDASRLYRLVSHQERPTMPPDEPRIRDELIEAIRTWIAQGAPKDRAQAEQLARERAAMRVRATADEEAAAAARGTRPVVMPERIPPLPRAFPARPGAMRAVAASPGAPLLAVPGFGQVLLLHADDLRELGVLAFPYGNVEQLAFTASGARLLAAGGRPGREGGAVLYDVRTGAELGRFGEQGDTVLAAAISPDGGRVAIGGTRRRVDVFEIEGGREPWQGSHDDWVTAVAFSPDGALVASADRAGQVIVREAPNGREVQALGGHDGAVTALAFSPDSSLLATAGVDRSVRAHRMRDGEPAWSQRGHRDQVLCLAWRSESRLLSGGADGAVVHWRSDGERERGLPELGEWVYGVAVSADGARGFAADWRGRLTVIDIESAEIAAQVVPLAIVD